MPAPDHKQTLITELAANLKPVRRLAPPWLRTLGWAVVIAAIGAWLLDRHGLAPMLARFGAAHDLGFAMLGSLLTALAAGGAAFQLAVPGRSRHFVWLPLPPLLLWIGASGWGCLRGWVAPGLPLASLPEAARHCLPFIVFLSIPLSLFLIVLLRRACPLRPTLAAVLVGLASAAAAASLLAIFHPFDAAATDLLVHALAVAIVVAANAALGGRLLTARRRLPQTRGARPAP